MKTYAFFLTMLFACTFGNDLFAQSQPELKTTEKLNQGNDKALKIAGPNNVIAGRLGCCPYPDCDQKVRQVREAFQEQANQNCQELMVDVVCCYENMETQALVIVRPNASQCRKMVDTPQHTQQLKN